MVLRCTFTKYEENKTKLPVETPFTPCSFASCVPLSNQTEKEENRK